MDAAEVALRLGALAPGAPSALPPLSSPADLPPFIEAVLRPSQSVESGMLAMSLLRSFADIGCTHAADLYLAIHAVDEILRRWGGTAVVQQYGIGVLQHVAAHDATCGEIVYNGLSVVREAAVLHSGDRNVQLALCHFAWAISTSIDGTVTMVASELGASIRACLDENTDVE